MNKDENIGTNLSSWENFADNFSSKPIDNDTLEDPLAECIKSANKISYRIDDWSKYTDE